MRDDAPDAVAFMQETGRLPWLEHEKDPWAYRGWMLPIFMEIEDVYVKRWGWWVDAQTDQGERIAQGTMKIPRVEFLDAMQCMETVKHAAKLTELAGRHIGWWRGVEYVVRFMLHGLGERQADDPHPRHLYDENINEQLYKTLNLELFVKSACDVFGHLFAEQMGNGKHNPNAFYPTPMSIVNCMVAMTMHDGVGSFDSVCDPCVGTGRMLLAASNFSLNLMCQDVDSTVLAITRLNGYMFCPWLVMPAPWVTVMRDAMSPSAPVDFVKDVQTAVLRAADAVDSVSVPPPDGPVVTVRKTGQMGWEF